MADLNRQESRKLLELVRALPDIPIEGERTVLLDAEVLQEVLGDPSALRQLYHHDGTILRRLIRDDSTAQDLLALARRREQLAHFHRLLDDEAFFAKEAAKVQGRPEAVWQRFIEANPWILGVSLAAQLFTSADDKRLEQVVAGQSWLTGPGNRTDALMQTAGPINNLVFVEIKHHRTQLLQEQKDNYRAGCWAPSRELAGGVVQIQQTVERAKRRLSGSRVAEKDETGADTGRFLYLVRPRNYLIIGRDAELCGPGGLPNQDKHSSFELFRRNLYEPEILTFDELLARATWHVDAAEKAEETATASVPGQTRAAGAHAAVPEIAEQGPKTIHRSQGRYGRAPEGGLLPHPPAEHDPAR